ncbi:syncytin-2-like [Python bivittatus]|uniref:Syncytin-2-like n=1 Tax=Python bivittatus TaxID=176946 RepID=A0A9F5J1F9_PYTBI|nr:syncytin-2-like [Python bivittatus]
MCSSWNSLTVLWVPKYSLWEKGRMGLICMLEKPHVLMLSILMTGLSLGLGVPLRNKREANLGLWQDNNWIQKVRVYLQLMESNFSNCWLCQHMPPKASDGLPLDAIPLSESEWKNPTQGPRGVFISQNLTQITVLTGSRIQHRASFCWTYQNTTANANTIFLGNYSNCDHLINVNSLYRFNAPSFSYANVTEYECNHITTGNRSIGGLPCNTIKALVQSAAAPPDHAMYHTNLVGVFWLLCGRMAYRAIPPYWEGTCTLGQLAPALRTSPALLHHCIQNRRDPTPVATNSHDHEQLLQGLPPLGVALNFRDIVKLSNRTEWMFNKTVGGLQKLNQEQGEIRQVVLQNREALDMLLTAQGGVCAVVHSYCCVYIHNNQVDLNKTVEAMENAITEKHADEARRWDTSWNPFSFLESWFPNISSFSWCYIAVGPLLLFTNPYVFRPTHAHLSSFSNDCCCRPCHSI